MQPEAVKIVRHGFKIAADQTQESITKAAVLIKIAVDVDEGATISEAATRHVETEHWAEVVNDLYKVAYNDAFAFSQVKRPDLAQGHPNFRNAPPVKPPVPKPSGMGRKGLAVTALAGLAAGMIHNQLSKPEPPNPYNQNFLGNFK
jgi:hypothetical protein